MQDILIEDQPCSSESIHFSMVCSLKSFKGLCFSALFIRAQSKHLNCWNCYVGTVMLLQNGPPKFGAMK